MSNYKLTDNVDDGFDLEIRDLKYVMRYPRTEELDVVQELNIELKAAQDEKRDGDVKEISGKLEDFLYQFITPNGHETPIKDALAKENVKVMQNFNKMLQHELSLS